MNTQLAKTKMINTAIRNAQLDSIRTRVIAIIEKVLEGIQNKDKVTQDNLCKEMCELESYVREVYKKYSTDIGVSSEGLDQQIQWVDRKALDILSML